MKRKKFILLATAGAAAIAVPTWYFKFRSLDYNPILKEPGLLSHIWDEETMLAIGEFYRAQYDDENNERELVKLLSTEDLSSTEILAESLQQQIVADYKEGSIVIIDGWVLSITEARQCALYSISLSK